MYPRAIALAVLVACGSNHPAMPDGAAGDAPTLAGSDAAPPLRPTTYVLFAEPKLAADATVSNRIVVVGTHDDDHTIATDKIVLGFDRPGAGTFSRPQVTLGALGADSYFSACNASVPGCLGPLTITAALASNPTVIVASLPVELVPPLELNPAKRCLTGGNILDLHGNDAIFTGDTTITDATWDAGWAFQESLILNVTPTGASGTWQLVFDTQRDSAVLAPGVYLDADKAWPMGPFDGEAIDHPAMVIRGFGHDCDTVAGNFQVEDYSVNNSGAQDVTISFEQHCNGDPTTSVTGCVHYQPAMARRTPIAGAHYEIRIAESDLTANGHTKHEVFVFGKNADGTTATDAVVLGIDRASAGSYLATSLGLGPLGARTYFTPCDAAGAGCTGPATLTLALASDPTTVIASARIMLGTAGHISTAAPCLAGGNIMYLDGNDYVRNGMLTVLDGVWQVTQPSSTDFRASLWGSKAGEGGDWELWLDTLALGGSLQPGVYVGVEQSEHADPGHAGMQVWGNSRSCGPVSGAFEIFDFDAAAGTYTVSFEEHCNGEAQLLEGCFHHEN